MNTDENQQLAMRYSIFSIPTMVVFKDGREAARAATIALDDAGVEPGEIDYVNAHASSTPIGDVAEARAIARALGERAATVPVSGTKALYGHPLGASGAIEAAIGALAIEGEMLHDAARNKDVPLKIYYPEGTGPFPVIVFSHSPLYKYYRNWNFWTDDADAVTDRLDRGVFW